MLTAQAERKAARARPGEAEVVLLRIGHGDEQFLEIVGRLGRRHLGLIDQVARPEVLTYRVPTRFHFFAPTARRSRTSRERSELGTYTALPRADTSRPSNVRDLPGRAEYDDEPTFTFAFAISVAAVAARTDPQVRLDVPYIRLQARANATARSR